MTTTAGRGTREGVLSPAYATTTIGMFSMIAFAAFESMAVTTIMPTVARDLDGFGYYALSFAAPFASGVIGMVAAGMRSDRRGPTVPLLVSMALFSLGLLVCGFSPTMEVFVAGRVLQGLGAGAMIVSLYVMVGLIYPARLQPAVFASFAAAWVLPALFGPALAAYVADVASWRWVFSGMVILVALALALISRAIRTLPAKEAASRTPASRLWWSLLAAASVLALELLGSTSGILLLGAGVAFVTMVIGLRPLLPAGTLRLARGLPSVIAVRGLLAASFFCAEAYVVYVLQEEWGLTPGRAGIALTIVGVVWAASSQAQSRLGDRVRHEQAMVFGATVVMSGLVALALTVWLQVGGAQMSAVLPVAAYVFASIGMGFAYPRTGVAMLAASGEDDRGFNSSALSIADSLGAALALSLAGVAYAAAQRADVDPFPAVYALAVGIGVVGVVAALRARAVGQLGR